MGAEVQQPVTARVEKTDKGKGKAKEPVRRNGSSRSGGCLRDMC